MKEHKLLKKIIETIGYEFENDVVYEKLGMKKEYYNQELEEFFIFDVGFTKKELTTTTILRRLNVKEIIFTTDFIEKYKEYFFNYYKDKHNQIGLNGKWSDLKLGLFNNLDNPVAYLYNKIINE